MLALCTGAISSWSKHGMYLVAWSSKKNKNPLIMRDSSDYCRFMPCRMLTWEHLFPHYCMKCELCEIDTYRRTQQPAWMPVSLLWLWCACEAALPQDTLRLLRCGLALLALLHTELLFRFPQRQRETGKAGRCVYMFCDCLCKCVWVCM